MNKSKGDIPKGAIIDPLEVIEILDRMIAEQEETTVKYGGDE